MDDGLRFDCLRCGECCRAWTVVVEKEHVDRQLRGVPWIEERSRERKARGFGPLLPPGPGAGRCHLDTSVGPRLDCVFLGQDGLCELHARIGPEAKPATCTQFPFHFVRTPEGVETALDPACAAVARGHGGPVDWVEIRGLQERGRIEALPEGLERRPGMPIAWGEYRELRRELRNLLGGDGPIEDRILRAWSLVQGVESHRPSPDPLGRRLALSLLLLVHRNAWDRKALPGGGSRALRRGLRLLKLAAGLLLGRGRLPLEARGMVVDAGLVDALPWTPDDPALRPIFDRWLRTWPDRHELAPIASRGVGTLLLTWLMIGFFTRAVAHGCGRSPTTDDAADGVQLAEKFAGGRTLRLAMREDALGRSLRSMCDGAGVVRWVLGR